MELIFKRPTSKKDVIGHAIVFGGRIASGDASHCHVAIKIGPLVYESLVFGGISCRLYKNAYENAPHDVIKVRSALMPTTNEKMAEDYINGLIGQFTGLYGIGKIPLVAGDAILSMIVRKRVFPLTKRFGIKSFHICSSLTAYILYKFGNSLLREMYRDWRALSPDDIWDIYLFNYPGTKVKSFNVQGYSVD
jgi:hypothetical protein